MTDATAADVQIINASLVLPDRLEPRGWLQVRGGRIAAVGADEAAGGFDGAVIDARGQYLAPGYIDMHVHGGAGADFMDGTPQRSRPPSRAHTRHGTTSIVPTSTVARHEQTLAFLNVCRRNEAAWTGRPRGKGVGGHLYGPYFAEEKVGCHPHEARPPTPDEYGQYLAFADGRSWPPPVAPELPGGAGFYRAAARGARRAPERRAHPTRPGPKCDRRLRAGRAARRSPVLRDEQLRLGSARASPARRCRCGGICEFVLATADMTTEVIADGRHLSPDLLRFALKMKGPDRLALVTDCNRGLDRPPGEYLFGPTDGGEPFYSDGTAGLMPDREGPRQQRPRHGLHGPPPAPERRRRSSDRGPHGDAHPGDNPRSRGGRRQHRGRQARRPAPAGCRSERATSLGRRGARAFRRLISTPPYSGSNNLLLRVPTERTFPGRAGFVAERLAARRDQAEEAVRHPGGRGLLERPADREPAGLGFERLFKAHGISEPKYNVLRILRGAGGDGLPCLEIGGRMITRVPDVTRLVDRLEAQSLVRRDRTAATAGSSSSR